jgi:hypothetical protein
MIAHVDAQFSKLFDAAVPAGFVLLPLFLFSGCGGPGEELPPVPGSYISYEQLESGAEPRSAEPQEAVEPDEPEVAEPELSAYERLELRLEQERRERQARLQAAAAAAADRERERQAAQAAQPQAQTRPLPVTPPRSAAPGSAQRAANPAPPTMGPTPEEIARAREINENKPTYDREDLFSTRYNILTLQGETEQTLLRRYGEPDSVFTYPDPRQFYQLWKHTSQRPPEVGRFARVKQYVYQQGATSAYFYMERQDSGDWQIITVIRDLPPGR